MNRLIPILIMALFAALPCRAQDPFFLEDKPGDVALHSEDTEGLDLVRIAFSRKGAGKIEIDFRMSGAIPKTPKGDYMIIAYLDFDGPAGGDSSPDDTEADLNILAFKVPGYANWDCKVDKTSDLLAKESFQIAKFNQYKDGFSIAVSSPLFKDPVRIRGYAETISGGKVLDRAPAEALFMWNEAGANTP